MKKLIAIIGGGPAGMMAAVRAGELGARVILLEKNKELGIKLLITGNGRCNLTNNIEDMKELVKQYGKNGAWLFSAFHKFGVSDVIDFFENRGLKTKVENDKRVFPVSDRSCDVLAVLQNYLQKNKVEVRKNSAVAKIVKHKNKIEKIILDDGEEIIADEYIIATGGKSYPATGSSGDGFVWLKNLGHTIVKPRPALVPVLVREKFVKELEGLSLKEVEIGVYKNNKKLISQIGEAIFTANGLSGPMIFGLSKRIGEELPDTLEFRIDFIPKLNSKELDQEIQKEFALNNNKIFRNSLNRFVQPKLISVLEKITGIDGAKKVNLITREERKNLIKFLKEFTLEIKDLAGFEKAIITAGGVDLKEVDPKTMKSKIIENLYFAGEILDLDGPTGGFNLQICWSTGYVAGESATLEKF